MKKFTGNYTTEAGKVLKGSECLICTVAAEDEIYICNGFVLYKMTRFEYAAAVQPVTCCDPGNWRMNKTGERTECNDMDLAKLFADTLKTADKAAALTRCPLAVQFDGKTTAATYYAAEADFTALFNTKFISALAPYAALRSAGSISAAIAYADDEPFAIVLPIKPKDEAARAVKAYFHEIDHKAEADKLRAECDKLRAELRRAQNEIECQAAELAETARRTEHKTAQHEEDYQMTYYEISEETARRANDANSMRDYKPGSATAEYRAAVDKAAALVDHKKQTVSPYYHKKLDALFDRYARRLAQWTNDYNHNEASCPSILISGGSNFPVNKKNKQNARRDSLYQEHKEIEGILDKISAIGTGAVDLADPHAREMLTDQLQKLQSTLDTGKAMNAHYRKHKTMQGFPELSEEAAHKMDEELSAAPAFAQKPFPDYELTSLRSKIKRTQARLDELTAREAEKEDGPAKSTKFDGGEIVRNLEADRLQVIFDEKPGEELRTALKKNGFRWSPKFNAWQRQLTQNAEYAARRILDLDRKAAAIG